MARHTELILTILGLVPLLWLAFWMIGGLFIVGTGTPIVKLKFAGRSVFLAFSIMTLSGIFMLGRVLIS